MNRRVCIITGGTSGIGLAAGRELSTQGFRLVLVGRSSAEGDRAVGIISGRFPSANVEFIQADISSMIEVRELASALSSKFAAIEILINNAGARFDHYSNSCGGIELTFATNHLGHYLLTHLLLDALDRSGSGRVITVSSGAHRSAKGDGVWQVPEGLYDRKQAYAKSKLANLLFAFELARRTEGMKVVSNAVDPGVVATRFARNNGLVAWAKHNGFHLLKGELRTPKRGAETIVQLATEPGLGSVSGKLFRDRKMVRPGAHALDRNLASALWRESSELVGLEHPLGSAWDGS